MSRSITSGISCAAIVVVLISASRLQAQQSTETAPVPQQVLVAKKVFISNAPSDAGDWYTVGEIYRPYNQFYAAMKSWGRYELVAGPADADLIFEITLSPPVQGVGKSSDPYLKLVVLEPKTRVPLWWLVADIQFAGRAGNRNKNFDSGMVDLIGQVKKLAGDDAGKK